MPGLQVLKTDFKQHKTVKKGAEDATVQFILDTV